MKNPFKIKSVLKAEPLSQAASLFHKTVLYAVLFLLPSTIGFSAPVPLDMDCPQPTNLVKTAQSNNSISFAWTPATGFTAHKVMYVRHDKNGDHPSQEVMAGANSHAFIGLLPGRYTFYIASPCGDITAGFIVTEDIING